MIQWPACFQGDWCQVFSCCILAVSSPLSIGKYCYLLYLFQPAAHSVSLTVNVRLTLIRLFEWIQRPKWWDRSFISFLQKSIQCFPSVIILCSLCVPSWRKQFNECFLGILIPYLRLALETWQCFHGNCALLFLTCCYAWLMINCFFTWDMLYHHETKIMILLCEFVIMFIACLKHDFIIYKDILSFILI